MVVREGAGGGLAPELEWCGSAALSGRGCRSGDRRSKPCGLRGRVGVSRGFGGDGGWGGGVPRPFRAAGAGLETGVPSRVGCGGGWVFREVLAVTVGGVVVFRGPFGPRVPVWRPPPGELAGVPSRSAVQEGGVVRFRPPLGGRCRSEERRSLPGGWRSKPGGRCRGWGSEGWWCRLVVGLGSILINMEGS